MPDLARFPPNRAAMPDHWAAGSNDRRPFFCPAWQPKGGAVLYFIIKAGVSGLIAATAAEVARRYPGWGGLVASLPLTSLMAMIWLWRDTGDLQKVAELTTGIFWFILPSLALFLVLPWLLRFGLGFWVAVAISVAGTLALYATWFWAAPKMGIKL